MSAIEKIPVHFHEMIADFGVEFDEQDIPKLSLYLDILLDTNKSFNLTAIKDFEHAWMRHIADSLSLIPRLVTEEVEHVVDIGSGGGLPGIPLAITLPDVTFTLVETTKKKALFLSQTAEALGLDNVTVLAERAENLSAPDGGFRDIADAVIARAVGPLNVLLELAIPFAKVGGVLLAIKGERAPSEIQDAEKALQLLQASVESTYRTATGTIVMIRKEASTPKKYPRMPGEPKRMPLGKKDK